MKTERVAELLEGILERLAAVEHERWSHWQKYMHSKCKHQPDGALVIPADLVSRWEQQIATPYEDLCTAEKVSDREQVRKYLGIIVSALSVDESPNP